MKNLLFLLALGALLLSGCNNDAEKLKKNGSCPGCDLTNAYFKNANFEGADISKANLLGVTMDGSKLKGVNFEESFLFTTSFMNADLTNANFKNATLVTANLRNAIIDGADFTGADLSGSIWLQGFRCQQGSIGVCYKTALIKLKATNNCEGCNLFKADLKGQTHTGSNFKHAVFHKADLRNAKFHNTNMGYANFKDALIEGADFTGSDLRGAKWINGVECGDGSIGKCVPHTNEPK